MCPCVCPCVCVCVCVCVCACVCVHVFVCVRARVCEVGVVNAPSIAFNHILQWCYCPLMKRIKCSEVMTTAQDV